MKRKPFTPDDCPLIPGSVIYDPSTNADLLVLARSLDYDDENPVGNCKRTLIKMSYGSSAMWYTGQELMNGAFEYYPNWPDTGETKPCWHEVDDRELIVDYSDNPDGYEDWEPSSKLRELCDVQSDYVACSVTYHKQTGTQEKDFYAITDNFYEWLDDRIQCEDCKNGCKIYRDDEGYYFCISGSGLDEVHIRIKPFTW